MKVCTLYTSTIQVASWVLDVQVCVQLQCQVPRVTRPTGGCEELQPIMCNAVHSNPLWMVLLSLNPIIIWHINPGNQRTFKVTNQHDLSHDWIDVWNKEDEEKERQLARDGERQVVWTDAFRCCTFMIPLGFTAKSFPYLLVIALIYCGSITTQAGTL